MAKTLLKIISIILIFLSTNTSVAGITVKLQKPESWNSVFVYAWGDFGEIFGAWPGQELTEEDSWYPVTLHDSITATNIIFNNNDGVQSENKYVTFDVCFEPTGGMNTNDEVVLASIPCNEGGITVGFLKPESWTQVYIYGYFNDAPVFDTWPGVMLTEEDGWYYYTMDALITEVSLIYNNNEGQQTQDVYVNGDACFRANEDLSMEKIDCGLGSSGPDANPEQPVFYPNPVNDILNVTGTGRVRRINISSLTGATVFTVSDPSVMTSINVENLEPGIYVISFMLEEGENITGKLIKNNVK